MKQMADKISPKTIEEDDKKTDSDLNKDLNEVIVPAEKNESKLESAILDKNESTVDITT